MKKKNLIAKELMTSKYKPRVIKPKKGKGSFKRKKKSKYFKVLRQFVELPLMTFQCLYLSFLLMTYYLHDRVKILQQKDLQRLLNQQF